ncbi:MAG: putative membrane protein [Pseudorhodobacter sp.]|jgi:putative membrane protein
MIAIVLVTLVAALHIYIMVMEMFLWERARTRRVFGLSADLAAQTKVLAANQGLYNGFLAAGLFWSLWLGLAGAGQAIAAFFLLCIVIAGVFGAATANPKIVLVQSVPAGLGLAALVFGV